jgi:hypothetical protein
MKLNVKAFGLACGLVWGGGLCLMTTINLFTANLEIFKSSHGWCGPVLELIGSVYPGYHITPIGALIGLGYGLVDGLIGGGLLALVYNFLSSRLSTTIKM